MSSLQHVVYLRDCRIMPELQDSSVQLVVTSPPYWQLKNYGGAPAAEIGFYQSYAEYIDSLSLVWAECLRVLEPGCRLCINVGDQFCSTRAYDRFKVMPIHAAIIIACEYLGFDYVGCVIWNKISNMRPQGGGKVIGSYPYPRECLVKMNFEYILIFKKPGATRRKIEAAVKEQARLTKEEWLEYSSGLWVMPGVRQDAYVAMFPVELPRRLIRMFTFPGEVVLDPFLGSGTTVLAAAACGRAGCGYEVSPVAQEVLKNKLSGLEEVVWVGEREESLAELLEARLEQLPFRYNDLHPVRLRPGAASTNHNKASAARACQQERTLFRDDVN